MFKQFFLKKFFTFIFKVKIKFKNPKKNDLIIFDDVNIRDLDNILNNRKFFILRVRESRLIEVFFTFKILFFFFKYLNKNIFTAYLAAIIKVINPKIILTSIDNSYKFHDLAKIFKHDQINFIAIQNAARYDFIENDYLFKKNKISENFNKRFYLPIYYCFGNHEELLCDKYNINVKSFYKYGSIRLSNYIKYKIKKKIKINKSKYDIVLLSEVFPTRLATNWLFYELVKYVIKYCSDNRLKFLFVPRGTGKEKNYEFNYLKKNLNRNEFLYLKNNCMKVNHKKFNSYIAVEESNLTIGGNSTMLRDKLTLGGKILSYNYTGLNVYNFPIRGICFLKNEAYNQFAKRIKILLSLSNINFFKLIKNKSIMFYNKKKFTFDYVNEHIDKLLKINKH